MKKFLLVLGMVTCLAGMTACGSKEDAPAQGSISQEELEDFYNQIQIDNFVKNVDELVVNNGQDQASGVYAMGVEAWEPAKEEIGNLVDITGHTITSDGENVNISVRFDGDSHDGDVALEIKYDTAELLSITVNVEKTMGELMTNAALNTLLGMGTVFIVLILISLLISCFKYISVAEKKLADKKAKKNAKNAPAAPAAAPAPVAAATEVGEEDDCELVAVIAAAIAASEGATSTDGFVVRSIKRRAGKWQKA